MNFISVNNIAVDLCWYIADKPPREESLNQIVLGEGAHHISFPLNDQLLYWETRVYQGPITIQQLLDIIYEFYKEPLDPKDYKRAFENREDEFDEIFEETDGNLKKIDALSEDPDPDFCGLEYNSTTNAYEVTLGPI